MFDVLFFTIVTIGCFIAAFWLVISYEIESTQPGYSPVLGFVHAAGVLLALATGCLSAAIALNHIPTTL